MADPENVDVDGSTLVGWHKPGRNYSIGFHHLLHRGRYAYKMFSLSTDGKYRDTVEPLARQHVVNFRQSQQCLSRKADFTVIYCCSKA